MAYETLIVDRTGDVGTITINRPKQLNALNSTVLRELTTALREMGREGECRALILTGAGEKAQEIGLCLEVLPRDQLMAHCRAVAEKIATKGPLAVARAKKLVERGYDIPLRSANRQEAETFALLFDTEDRREGMRAFLEKRAPKYVGK